MSNKQQYRTILKSSSLIGGSAVINIFIGMVRTKFVAILLGPAGVGLAGMFTTILSPIQTLASMGISTSGVRQIAEANREGDGRRISELVFILRRTVWATGILGCLTTMVLSPWLSRWTFKTDQYTYSIAFLALTILFANIAVGQSCVLRGTRRIADLAKLSIWGALNGTLIGIPCFYLWGMRGIVVSLFTCSFANLVVSWNYARRVKLEKVHVSFSEMKPEVRNLLGFGFPVMLSDLQGVISAYLLRLMVLYQFQLAGVGLWGAAYNISGLLANFVLNAMGADYYPRLVGVVHDKKLLAQEISSQTEIALLLAVPGLLATILFAPLGIELLYSGRFDGAIPVLRWYVYGVLGRVISWPLGYVLLAKGCGKIFFVSEFFMNLFYLAAVWFCGRWLGLPGTGVAFVMLYLAYIVVISIIVYAVSRAHWSWTCLVLVVSSVALLVFAGLLHVFITSQVVYYSVSAVVLLITSIIMLKQVVDRTGISIQELKKRFLKM